MSETENSIVELYIDNKFVQTLEKNEKREDVIKAILDCGGKTKNPIPGFNKIIDISNLANGTHTLEIRIRNKTTNEILTSQSTKFYIDSSNVSMYIDDPIYNQNVESKLYVRGWVMSESQNIDIKLYINNQLVDTIERNEKREDVIKAIIGYGGITSNPIPGFNKEIDISNYKNGNYKITVKIIDKNTNETITYNEVYVNKNQNTNSNQNGNQSGNQNESTKKYLNGIDVSHHQGVIGKK